MSPSSSEKAPASRGTDSVYWANLGLVAIVALYTVYTAWTLHSRGLFEYVGIDFRAIYASGEIARTTGFDQVYSLAAQDRFQRPLYDAYSGGPYRLGFDPVPMPYLSVFVALFQPLVALSPVPAFLFWSALNATALVAYLFRFVHFVGGKHPRADVAMILFSLPAFFTLFFGQVNVWLLICVGEFMIAGLRGRPFRSGLWIGGLVLKPQTLIVLAPALLLARHFRTFVGMCLSTLVALAISAYLAGVGGIVDLLRLVSLYPGGLPTNSPESMMNWRALAMNLSAVAPDQVAWTLAMAGLLLTLVVVARLWWPPMAASDPRFVILLLGSYAATCAVTWHAHVHMALPLAIPLLYLVGRGWLPRSALNIWVLLPPAVFLMVGFTLNLGLGHRIVGIATLGLNLYFVGVAWSALRNPLAETAPSPSQGLSSS